MAQGRLDFAIREREYREQAAQEVRDRAATLLDRLGAYAKAILRQSRYRVVGYRAEADTGHVERNRTTLTADDFAVLSVDLLNGCLVVPEVGLKYVGVTVREFQITDGDGGREIGPTEEPVSLPSKPALKVMASSEPCTPRDEPGAVEIHPSESTIVRNMAEWIFAQHPREAVRPRTYKSLKESAEKLRWEGTVFKEADFLSAYRLVYQSENHRPPALGWPLREPYKSCLQKEVSAKK